jgi:hypothetical protein
MDVVVGLGRFSAKLSLDDVYFLRAPFEVDRDDILGYGYRFVSGIGDGVVMRLAYEATPESRVVTVPGSYVELYLGSSAMTQLRLTGKIELALADRLFCVEMPEYESATSEWRVPRSA